MEKILSIIIPTYNMENYIEQCINSLIINTQLDKLDILIINDGSKDNSLIIAQKYSNKYPGIVKVIDKKNGNYGSCINEGLKEAKGKYIKILDADDSFCTQNLELLIKELKYLNVDIVISDYNTIDTQGKTLNHFSFNLPLRTEFYLQSGEYLNSIKENLSMHAVLYNTAILNEIHYKQTEGISYTDQEWIFLPLAKCNKAYYFNNTIYNYLLGREGQTMDQNVFMKNIGQLCVVTLSLVSQYNKLLNKNDFQEKYLKYRLINNLYFIYYTYIFKKYNESQELILFDHKLKEINGDIYNLTNSFIINKIFKFVSYWRKNKKKNMPFLIKINILIKKIF